MRKKISNDVTKFILIINGNLVTIMGFWRRVCYVIAMVMIAGGQPSGQLPKINSQKTEIGSIGVKYHE